MFQTVSTSHSCTSNPVFSCYPGGTSKTLTQTVEVSHIEDFSPFQIYIYIYICGSHPILSESGLYLFWLFLNTGLPILGKGFSWLNPNLLFPITELFVYKSLHLLSPLPTCYLLPKFYLTFPTQFTNLLLFLWNLPRLCFPEFISLLSSNICITHLFFNQFYN